MNKQQQQQQQQQNSPRRSSNKIYRTPPTPPPQVYLMKEKEFIIDSIAAGSISDDYSKANPKLGPIVPPYNSQRDKSCLAYFKRYGVDRTLEKTQQLPPNDTSIDGKTMDRFDKNGPGRFYLNLRNQSGMGHSRELIDGHAQFMQNVKPIFGWHGGFGYRRNTPWLRREPSCFGLTERSYPHLPSVITPKSKVN